MKSKYLKFPALVTLLLLANVCEEPDYPASLFDPDYVSDPQPVIHSITPPDSCWAGVGEITIQGENFDPSVFNNLVSFGIAQAEVISASASVLVIKTPAISGDSLAVRVAVLGSELYNDPVHYRLLPSVITYTALDAQPYGLDIDAEENIYISTEDKNIMVVGTDGKANVFSSVFFTKAPGLKFGTGGSLFAAWDAGRVKGMSIIDMDVIVLDSAYASLGKKPADLDFDQYGYMWVGAETELIRIDPDATVTTIDTYPVNIQSVRVYNDALYVVGSGTSDMKIWSSAINADGSLGTRSVVLDIAGASWLEGATVYAITFDSDGDMYLGTDHPTSPLFVYNETSGDYAQFYPGLISGTAYRLSWGNGSHLYVSNQKSTGGFLLKIDVQQNLVRQTTAPYYGREL
ncbi:IPT/TIG domain-containing protein [Candidatus Neomarinimicrobiota bacterium]